MYTYGIAKIEINSCNKESYTYKVALVSSFIPANTQRLRNLKKSSVYCSAPTGIYICDTLPLDNLSDLHTYSTAVHNIVQVVAEPKGLELLDYLVFVVQLQPYFFLF